MLSTIIKSVIHHVIQQRAYQQKSSENNKLFTGKAVEDSKFQAILEYNSLKYLSNKKRKDLSSNFLNIES